jgi:DNA-directed RNA polymerase subunit RPC12/RpoP
MREVLRPDDDTDFGGNEWFGCPECDRNLKLFWFMHGDSERCEGCGSKVIPQVVVTD